MLSLIVKVIAIVNVIVIITCNGPKFVSSKRNKLSVAESVSEREAICVAPDLFPGGETTPLGKVSFGVSN